MKIFGTPVRKPLSSFISKLFVFVFARLTFRRFFVFFFPVREFNNYIYILILCTRTFVCEYVWVCVWVCMSVCTCDILTSLMPSFALSLLHSRLLALFSQDHVVLQILFFFALSFIPAQLSCSVFFLYHYRVIVIKYLYTHWQTSYHVFFVSFKYSFIDIN